MQRTVQYIAGAGIGYKIVSSTVGPGTHVAANQDVPEYSIKSVSNEIAVSDSGGSYPTGPGGNYPTTTQSAFSHDDVTPAIYNPTHSVFSSTTPYPPLQHATHQGHQYSNRPVPTQYPTSTPRPFVKPHERFVVTTPSSVGGIDRHYGTSTVSILPSGGPSPLAPSGPSGPSGSDEHNDIIYGLLPPKVEEFYHPLHVHITPHPPPRISSGYVPSTTPIPTYLPSAEASQAPHPFIPPVSGPANPFHQVIDLHHHHHHDHPQAFVQPTIAPSHHPPPTQIPEYHHHDNPNIPPSSYHEHPKRPINTWFYGPQPSLRAHIQNIDLVPSHRRALSPSDALRLDELREQHSQHHQAPPSSPAYHHHRL